MAAGAISPVEIYDFGSDNDTNATTPAYEKNSTNEVIQICMNILVQQIGGRR